MSKAGYSKDTWCALKCKICGVSNSRILNFIVNHKFPPQFIGFIVNYPKSKRYVELNKLKELIKIDKKITDLSGIVNKIDQKLNNKRFIERAPSDIINQNISNKAKIENDILSLRSLRDTLSD